MQLFSSVEGDEASAAASSLYTTIMPWLAIALIISEFIDACMHG